VEAASAENPIGREKLLADATFLASASFNGRGSATEDEARAAEWIAQELDREQLGRLGDRIQPFAFGKRQSRNVVAVIEPSTQASERSYVVLGAHYDHLGTVDGQTFLGAEDNASGTAVALGVAKVLQRQRERLRRPVLVVFFGAEELGLRGSSHFVRSWPKSQGAFTAMVNLDMIGRPLVDDRALWFAARLLGVLRDVDPAQAVGVLLSRNAPTSFRELVKTKAEIAQLRAVFPEDLPESLRSMVTSLAEGRSDHAPFEQTGVPTIFFSSGESPDYHRTTDRSEKLDADLMAKRAALIVDVVMGLSRRED
jgi:Zn-dependent M28 family amino/carboxypeptidase